MRMELYGITEFLRRALFGETRVRRYFLRAGIIMLFTLWMISPGRGQDHGLGLGFILGEPTGVDGKLWLGDVNAIDFGFGWSLGGYGLDKYDVSSNNDTRFHVHVDFLWHDYSIIQTGERFPIYYGVGARMNSGAGYTNSWAARAIGGIAWVPRSTPIDLFIEVAPVLQFNPSTRVGLNAGIGARYYLFQ